MQLESDIVEKIADRTEGQWEFDIGSVHQPQPSVINDRDHGPESGFCLWWCYWLDFHLDNCLMCHKDYS